MNVWIGAAYSGEPRGWFNSDRHQLLCICPDPTVDDIGECRSCYRKPYAQMYVTARERPLLPSA